MCGAEMVAPNPTGWGASSYACRREGMKNALSVWRNAASTLLQGRDSGVASGEVGGRD